MPAMVRTAHGRIGFRVMDRRPSGDQGHASSQTEEGSRGCPTAVEVVAGKPLSAGVGSPPENRDLRQLLWHRHRLVQMRTRIMNQLQAIAMGEGVRLRKSLWSRSGRAKLESLQLAPWAAKRRKDLLELLDHLTPKIEELNVAFEHEAWDRPEVRHLMTHPGVGPVTALAFVLIIGTPWRF